MANTITKTAVADGANNLILDVHISGDGTGDESATVVADSSALVSGNKILYVDKVEANLIGFSCKLEYDLTANEDICTLSEGDSKLCFDFPKINSEGAGDTGDIVMSTNGLGSGDIGFIRIHARKRKNRGY